MRRDFEQDGAVFRSEAVRLAGGDALRLALCELRPMVPARDKRGFNRAFAVEDVERFIFVVVHVQRALLAGGDVQELRAVEFVVADDLLETPIFYYGLRHTTM